MRNKIGRMRFEFKRALQEIDDCDEEQSITNIIHICACICVLQSRFTCFHLSIVWHHAFAAAEPLLMTGS